MFRRDTYKYLKSYNLASRKIVRPVPLTKRITRNSAIRARFTLSTPLQNGHSLSIVVGVVTTVLLGGIVLFFPSLTPASASIDSDTPSTSDCSQTSIMVSGPLPGRPGNLTAEQETKLYDFWVALLNVFGVYGRGVTPLNGTNEGSSALKEAEQRARSDTGSSESKKKRRSLFSRKHHDTDASGDQSDAYSDSDDKYGQTNYFQYVLANQSPEELRQAFWSMVKHDDPDALLLRFLRARKWNVQKALVMLVATMHWRMQEVHVDDDVVKRGEGGAFADSLSSNAARKKEGNDFLAQLRMGKSFLHGTDKDGRPMCFVRVRLHKQGEQSEASLERYTVYVIETARLLLSRHVDTAAIVFDMTGFSMANMVRPFPLSSKGGNLKLKAENRTTPP